MLLLITYAVTKQCNAYTHLKLEKLNFIKLKIKMTIKFSHHIATNTISMMC